MMDNNMKILILKDTITNEYYKCKIENSSTKIGGFILHQKKNGEYRSCELVNIKEVKKMKKQVDYKKLSYFETKVVKVKKEKENRKPNIYSVKCTNCGHFTSVDIDEKKFKKGNWINGENLDKIKFPVPCSYVKDGERKLGLFSMNRGYYYIADITSQKKEQEDVSEECDNLKKFILFNNIHILKGKIILFEEVMKNGRS